MAESQRSIFRVLLTLSIVLTTILVTIVTSQSINPWSHANDNTYQDNDNTTDAALDHHEEEIGASKYTTGTVDIERNLRESNSALILAQILFRHGDRAPTDFYPTDPHKMDWPMGAGELTQQGMLQGHELGQDLRHHYNEFLGGKLNFHEVYIRSADVHRSIVSAECVATGLFPANFSKGNWPFGRWQPVPIHTFPQNFDRILCPSTVCKYVDDLRNGLLALYDSKQKLLTNKDLMFQLSHHTAMEMNVKTLHQLSDNIYYVKVHNMTLPSWLTKEMEEQLIAHHFTHPSFLVEQARYLAGMLLQDMLSNVHKKLTNSQDELKMYLYSGDDLNIHALMSLLEVYNEGQVTCGSASAFILELHNQTNQYFIKLLYKPDKESTPQVLIAPGCADKLCPLSKFEKLYGESIEEDWDQVCGEEVEERFIDFGEQTVPILISVLIFLLIMDLILLYKACLYHSRLRMLPFKDEYSLVQTQQDSSDEGAEIEIVSDNSTRRSAVQNGGGKIVHLKRGKREQNHQNHNFGMYSDSDEDSCEETTVFMSHDKTKKEAEKCIPN